MKYITSGLNSLTFRKNSANVKNATIALINNKYKSHKRENIASQAEFLRTSLSQFTVRRLIVTPRTFIVEKRQKKSILPVSPM